MAEYNKLIRDNIPEIIKNDGYEPITRILSKEELLIELNKKLIEECNEYLESNNYEELMDVEEVIEAILDVINIDKENFNQQKNAKREKRGGFKKGIYLIKTLEK